MRNLIYFSEIIIVVWISCNILAFAAAYKIIKNIIIEDLNNEEEENYVLKFSSVIALIGSLIFTIILFRISNKFSINVISNDIGTLQYLLYLFGSSVCGSIWMSFVINRYKQSCYNYDYTNARISRNISVFIIATSVLTLILATPDLIDTEISELREIYLAFYFGGTLPFIFQKNNNETQSFISNIFKRL